MRNGKIIITGLLLVLCLVGCGSAQEVDVTTPGNTPGSTSNLQSQAIAESPDDADTQSPVISGSPDKADIQIPLYESGEDVGMIPYDTETAGVYGGYIFIPLGDEIYRFYPASDHYEGLTKGELLYECIEESVTENYAHSIYALEEYPDHELLYNECRDAEGNLLNEIYIEYSPAIGVSAEDLDRIAESGYLILEDGSVTGGEDVWTDFYEKASSGKSATVRIAKIHTLDPERCSPEYYEAVKADYPSIFITELSFDGTVYKVSPVHYDGNEYTISYLPGYDNPVTEWKYLMHYAGEAPYEFSLFSAYDKYVLVNDNSVTWEDLEHGMLSSQMGDYIPFEEVYCEYTWK